MKYTFITILLTILFTPFASFAANYSVAPILIDHTLEGRSILSETVKITNNENRILRLYAAVNEITVGTGGEIQTFVPPSMSDNTVSVTSWIEISRARLELRPGETRELPMTIKINPNAKPGSYHAYVGFGDGRNRGEAEAKIRNGQAEGVIVKISLDEERNDFLRLANFVVQRFVTEEGNGGVTFDIQNPTDKDIIPAGEVIFYDSRGREVAALPVNPDHTAVPAGETVSFEDSVPIPESSVGRHKAYLSVEYGENQLASVQDTTFFYIVPIKQLVILFVIVLLVAVSVTFFIHRRYSGDDVDEEEEFAVAMFDRRGAESESKDHDVDLRKTD